MERRRLLALRRRRSEISGAYRRVAAALCPLGVRTTKLMPVRLEQLLGPLVSGPGQDEELDFSRIPGARTHPWSTAAERDTLCRTALSAVAAPGEAVALIWHPARAGARIGSADFRAHAGLLLDEGRGDTTWIVSASEGPWLIQVGYWSATLSWAPNMPLHSR